MYIQSIEPTPSPNTMKLTLSESLGGNQGNSYSVKNKEAAPERIQLLFDIEGVKAVYHVADFIAIDRHPKKDWKEILPAVRSVFGEASDEEKSDVEKASEHFGEVTVQLQMFKGIPMQIKLVDGEQEKREGLPERFIEALTKVQSESDNVVLERKWVDHGIRYGELDDIAKEVREEVSAAYPKERLDQMIEIAQNGGQLDKEKVTINHYMKVTLEMLNKEDWRDRYAVLDRMDPSEEDLPVLEKALEDEKASIRRLATMYLGMIEKPSVLPLLYKALKDPSVTVRRTAGDCLSDIGDPSAIPEVIKSLGDKNKLVRWRAAMFLNEVGDERAIEALRAAENDPEFEVALQVKMALERIEGGEEAKGSVWKQMTDAFSSNREKKE
ncbi:conserved virulence factor C family protein [Alkalihalobacillus trypoxylicola]|uniref:Virulence factor n=1 Tax=Alkalihalobacillus trypoxylicola TaxID=519424 RepID=A0A161P5M9_9BACI|nr:conserved virulence factor C family protein [Alkalihalobacillus trypoxylicola]KYG25523.1 virulence factor [Alkalihalobacillus trypoxylicola]